MKHERDDQPAPVFIGIAALPMRLGSSMGIMGFHRIAQPRHGPSSMVIRIVAMMALILWYIVVAPTRQTVTVVHTGIKCPVIFIKQMYMPASSIVGVQPHQNPSQGRTKNMRWQQ